MPSVARPRPTRWRRVVRQLRATAYLLLGLLTVGAVLAWVSTDHFRAFGGAAPLAQLRRSRRLVDGRFQNPQPTALMTNSSVWRYVTRWLGGSEMRAPTCPLPFVHDTAVRLATPPSSGLRVTWLGHSTTLIEIDGARVLTDPIWSDRASPSRWVGPRRFHPPPLAFANLPPLDAVVISHEHYDHLDMATVRALAARGVPFHVPLGIGAHLALWGVPAAQIVEHDWWEGAMLSAGVQLVSTPARHFNGRGVPGRVGALWTSWSLVGPRHRVFFSGDTGLTPTFREIAAREGPFDVALIEIGQSDPSWNEIHLGPTGALAADVMLGSPTLIPVHWATFQLAFHAWSEPPETLVHEASERGIPVLTPELGEPVEPTMHPVTHAWWRALPPLAPRCP